MLVVHIGLSWWVRPFATFKKLPKLIIGIGVLSTDPVYSTTLGVATYPEMLDIPAHLWWQ
jgi:hypothetical protein